MHGLRTVYPVNSNLPVPINSRIVFSRRLDDEEPLACGNIPAAYSGEPTTNNAGTIKKPKGQAGCLSRGGYSLRRVLGDWDTPFYMEVQVRYLNRLIPPRH